MPASKENHTKSKTYGFYQLKFGGLGGAPPAMPRYGVGLRMSWTDPRAHNHFKNGTQRFC